MIPDHFLYENLLSRTNAWSSPCKVYRVGDIV